jgi:chitin disaccharide deacetylase
MPHGGPRPNLAVVINADDLGRSESINQAILVSFDLGWVTSATVMANMPGFADACHGVAARKVQDRIGVHLNLTEGQPLSDLIRLCPRLCGPDGQLGRVRRPLWRLSRAEIEAIEAEFAAQIDALLAFGVNPSHLDSHHHVHTQWPVCTIVMRLARRYGISAIRLTRNCGSRPGVAKRIYKTAFNARLAGAGLAQTRHFGSAVDAASIVRFAGPVEIMVHPSLDEDGQVIDIAPGAQPLEDVAARWRTTGKLVSYRELRGL